MIEHPVMRNIIATDPSTGRNIIHPTPPIDLNRKLYIALYQCLPANLQSLHTTDDDNARTNGSSLWHILDRKYGKKKQHFADVSDLIHQYETIKRNSNESIETFYIRFSNLIDTLAANNHPLPIGPPLIIKFLNLLGEPTLIPVVTEISTQGRPDWWQHCNLKTTSELAIAHVKAAKLASMNFPTPAPAPTPSPAPAPSPAPSRPTAPPSSDAPTQPSNSDRLPRPPNPRYDELKALFNSRTITSAKLVQCALEGGCYIHPNANHAFFDCNTLNNFGRYNQCLPCIEEAKQSFLTMQDQQQAPAPSPSP